MKLSHLRTNHVSTPLGLNMTRPVFTWTAYDTPDKKQAAAGSYTYQHPGGPISLRLAQRGRLYKRSYRCC